MADYYPLIARAIAALDPNAPGESRRALYERARTALIAQLRSVQPPLSESEITRERLSLEEAVRKVESEAAQRAREASRPGGGGRSGGSGDAFRRASTRAAEGNAAAGSPSPPRTRPAPPPRADRPSANVDDQGDAQRPPRAPRFDASRQAGPAAPPAMPEPPAAGRDRAGPRRPPDLGAPASPPPAPGVRGFRDITADANDLGGAAAQASRAARRTYANVPSPSPEFDRLEPSLENRAGEQDAPYSYDESIEEAERYAPQPPSPRPRIAPERDAKKRVRTGSAFPFKSAIAVGIVLILVGAGILWGKPLLQIATNLFKSSPTQVVETPSTASQPQTKPKIPDRVGQPSASDQPVAPVAQKVVLYDEDPSDPKGKQYVGSVVWRLEPIKASGNQKADVAVRADIEIPDRKFKMTMSFRRNTDSSLPASHTAELTFILPPDFPGGSVSNVPGILMKSNEQARGTPLAGLAVKVTEGFFLVGLSNVDADRARNVQLLKERSWFDVPLVYANQRRAIIAIEKGAPGERAFNDAFAQWGD
ncbi:hypothetical protein C7U92_13490 [Bradyrhizobium sp. WBOS7]|uniref:Uncharacterized protein n=1 Tax=Bradyrhizobium betae TaxID=244734 RepID=A0AAE9NAK5_9BRAD|nr:MULTISPECIES: hypothetical protein [Bradyrhizobium]MDD1571099.1 hypothetical protein [Bradyrhizobium sp. WBOS1]UUO35342.1 hypothetical protein DCK84_12725 [Bradyrhizobium sp. WBOS01]MDD1527688.1 hypothetical protein [Bradyrhizobium sp. WBOS2]MDD1577739.1 hypothetical protein [Bradyrhizobium sp. WBOS7]MDD1600685.1 hypothetical protein [Bradyrhizobium sp. WBOS16]